MHVVWKTPCHRYREYEICQDDANLVVQGNN
jgi:hypothetical protein